MIESLSHVSLCILDTILLMVVEVVLQSTESFTCREFRTGSVFISNLIHFVFHKLLKLATVTFHDHSLYKRASIKPKSLGRISVVYIDCI